ncbi:hypothetical protein YQE_03801, partial [Dendroctonus ponderosae]
KLPDTETSAAEKNISSSEPLAASYLSVLWLPYQITIGKLTTSFTIILEVVGAKHILSGATVAFDNIELHDCFFQNESCSPHQHICSDIDLCINSTSTCDFNEDCPEGDDERLNCGRYLYAYKYRYSKWCNEQPTNPAILN